jgi:hypothetical protein
MRGNEQEDKSDRRKPNEREIRHKGRQEKDIQQQRKNWIREKGLGLVAVFMEE